MPVQPNFLERTAFYTFNQAPGVMLDMAGLASYQALTTAIKLGVFDALAAQPQSAVELANMLELQERGVAALLIALEAVGYVEARNGQYANSNMTQKWLIDSEAFDGRAIMSFWDDVATDIWPHAAEVIRTGQRPYDVYDWIESDAERNWSFQQTLVVTAEGAGDDIARNLDLPGSATRLLDVAGGHGIFSIKMCQKYPNLTATLIERPAAVEVASRHIKQHGLEGRINLVSGDLWEIDWGTRYDAVLLFNLLHHFDMARNAVLLRKANSSLAPAGKVAILDQIAGKISGKATNAFIRLIALQYYVMADGRVYTHDELEMLLSNTGFRDITVHTLSNLPGTSLMTGVKQ